jgi:hypothetical protein
MYLVPPMDDEPPPEFVAFVVTHVEDLHASAHELVGGDPEGDHLYMDVLADVAGHWRRLGWWSRWSGRDAASDYLKHRLHVRTARWRDDQIYEVDVRVLPPGIDYYAPYRGRTSIALRKAPLLPGTVRGGVTAVADAGIAWVQAYRRQQWHQIARVVATGVILIGGMIQYMSWLSVPSQ